MFTLAFQSDPGIYLLNVGQLKNPEWQRLISRTLVSKSLVVVQSVYAYLIYCHYLIKCVVFCFCYLAASSFTSRKIRYAMFFLVSACSPQYWVSFHFRVWPCWCRGIEITPLLRWRRVATLLNRAHHIAAVYTITPIEVSLFISFLECHLDVRKMWHKELFSP